MSPQHQGTEGPKIGTGLASKPLIPRTSDTAQASVRECRRRCSRRAAPCGTSMLETRCLACSLLMGIEGLGCEAYGIKSSVRGLWGLGHRVRARGLDTRGLEMRYVHCLVFTLLLVGMGEGSGFVGWSQYAETRTQASPWKQVEHFPHLEVQAKNKRPDVKRYLQNTYIVKVDLEGGFCKIYQRDLSLVAEDARCVHGFSALHLCCSVRWKSRQVTFSCDN